MRRTDRQVTDVSEIKGILDKADVMRIALNNGDYPYILPVNFGYEMNNDNLTLIFHSANEGTKHSIIKNDNRVVFEVDCEHALIAPRGIESCTASFAYASVIGQGIIEKAAEEDKKKLLTILLKHYGIEANTFSQLHLSNTTVYTIKVQNTQLV